MKNILSLLILLISFNATAQYSYATANKAKKFAKTITEKDLKDHLYTYASDEFQGRDTGSEGEDIAIKYLADFEWMAFLMHEIHIKQMENPVIRCKIKSI